MRNVQMIRTEPGLIWIPLERALYCENCETVSTSVQERCGLCGSEDVVMLATLVYGPPDPELPPAAPAIVRFAA